MNETDKMKKVMLGSIQIRIDDLNMAKARVIKASDLDELRKIGQVFDVETEE